MTDTPAQMREMMETKASHLCKLGVQASYRTEPDIHTQWYRMGYNVRMTIMIPVRPQGSVTMRLYLYFHTNPGEGEGIEQALLLLYDYAGQLQKDLVRQRIIVTGNTYVVTKRRPLVNLFFKWNRRQKQFEYFGSMCFLPDRIYELALIASDEGEPHER